MPTHYDKKKDCGIKMKEMIDDRGEIPTQALIIWAFEQYGFGEHLVLSILSMYEKGDYLSIQNDLVLAKPPLEATA